MGIDLTKYTQLAENTGVNKINITDSSKSGESGGLTTPSSISIFNTNLSPASAQAASTGSPKITLGAGGILSFNNKNGTITQSNEFTELVTASQGKGTEEIKNNLRTAETSKPEGTEAVESAKKNEESAKADETNAQKDVKDAENQQTSDRTAYENAKEVRNGYQDKVDELTETGTKLKSEISGLKGEISALKSKLAAQASVDKTGAAYADLQKQITAKEAELKKKESEYTKNQTELGEQKGLLAKAEISCDEAESKLGISDRLVLGAKSAFSLCSSIVKGAGSILSGIVNTMTGQQGSAISSLSQMLGNNGNSSTNGLTNSQYASQLAAAQVFGNQDQQLATNNNAYALAAAAAGNANSYWGVNPGAQGINFGNTNANTSIGSLLNGSSNNGLIGTSGSPVGNINYNKLNLA